MLFFLPICFSSDWRRLIPDVLQSHQESLSKLFQRTISVKMQMCGFQKLMRFVQITFQSSFTFSFTRLRVQRDYVAVLIYQNWSQSFGRIAKNSYVACSNHLFLQKNKWGRGFNPEKVPRPAQRYANPLR